MRALPSLPVLAGSVAELIAGVRILLGSIPMSECSAVDADGDRTVGVDEMVGAVASALDDCAR